MRDLIILGVVICFFFTFMLGNRALSVPDEGRYVEIPREMVATGDYVTPRLNGVKYFEKPVLFYWLEALSIRQFGLREYTLRLWPAVFALFGCLAVAVAATRLFGRLSGILSAAVLATSLLYYGMSRAIILDMPVSVLLTIALLSFLIGTRAKPGIKRRIAFGSFYACSALAVLTKGLIGIFIPAMVIGAWIIVLGEWRIIRTMYLPSGLVIFLLIAAPWHVLVSRANPEFFHFYFIQEHFLRYLTRMHGRYHPAWFFIPIVLLGLFPWSAFVVQAIRHNLPASWRERHEHRETIFLILWAGLVFLFFSASSSKLIPYILPVLPPLSILIGRYLADAWESRAYPGIRAGHHILLAVSMLLAGALFAAHALLPNEPVRSLGVYQYSLAITLAAGALTAWTLARYRGLRHALIATTVMSALFLLQANAAAPRVDTRSIKPLAMRIKPLLKPGDEVVSYSTYYQDLPVYLERRITVVGWKGELEFGTTVENTSAWMTDPETFWKRWQGQNLVFLFTRKSDYQDILKNRRPVMFPVVEDQRNIVLCNREVHP